MRQLPICFASRSTVLKTFVRSSKHRQHSACSQDPIPTSILKEFMPESLPIITRMCNQSVKEGVLPASQKKAVISPILKKAGSDPMDVKNYRPISNLTFMSKLVERLVNRQLVIYLEGSRLLPKFQSGFRSGHSTETALQKVMSDILTAADSGKVSILGLLDMSAAFDTVDHAILFERLKSAYRFFGTVLSWVCSFLTDREQRVVFNGQSSSTSTVKLRCSSGKRSWTAVLPTVYSSYTIYCGGIRPGGLLLCG